jgi:hypothetical protein
VRARPDEVVGARLAPGELRQRVGLHRLQIVRHVERAQHHAGDLVMAERVVVQAIVVEESHVLHLLQRPLVGHDAVVAVGDRPDVLVVDGDAPADAAEHRRELGVHTGEDEKRRTLRTQPGDGILELLRHGVRVSVGTQDVVSAGGERDEVGVECEARARPDRP